jgi:hypothetical protein
MKRLLFRWMRWRQERHKRRMAEFNKWLDEMGELEREICRNRVQRALEAQREADAANALQKLKNL